MTVILLILDTSASMAQKSYQGISVLDHAKNIVAEFQKARSKDVTARGLDRYMLMTTEDFPNCIKSGWREGTAVMTEQLKSMRPKGRNSMASTLLNAFKFVNLNRGNTGLDNYGYGRCPFYLEPVVLVAITDNASVSDVPKDLKLEFNSKGTYDMTKEAFRWDQRLYTVVLRMSSQPVRTNGINKIDGDADHMERLCSSTGGRSFSVDSHRQIPQVIESIVHSIHFVGVNVRFQCPALTARLPATQQNGGGESQSSSDIPPELRLKKRLEMRPLTFVMVKYSGGKLNGNWPIPEAFWHDRIDGTNLPARSSHPAIVFSIDPQPSVQQVEIPFDKYELEPSPVVDFVLEKFQNNQSMCFQVFVHNSGKTEGYGKPFGFLKVASTGLTVNLFLMPYNYPVLVALLEELKNNPNCRSIPTWRARLDKYLENVPSYYLNPLRRNLARLKLTGGILDEQSSGSLFYSTGVLGSINRVKVQGKEEFEKTCAQISMLLQNPPGQINYTLPVYSLVKWIEHILENDITGIKKLFRSYQNDPNKYDISCLVPVERRRQVICRTHWRSELEMSRKETLRKDHDRGQDPRNAMDKKKEVDEEQFRDPADGLIDMIPEKLNIVVHIGEPRIGPSNQPASFRNPYVIRKQELTDRLARMRANMDMLVRDSAIPLLDGGKPGANLKLHQAEELHSLEISRMGVYDDYMKALVAAGGGPLREVEPTPVRIHTFGNPFKTDKKSLAIDEVGESPVISSSPKESRKERRDPHRTGPPKRKPGPLASNTMQRWREHRRTISERSSIASDVSSIADLIEDLDEPSSSNFGTDMNQTLVNGFAQPINGNGSSTLDNCGLADDSDDDEPLLKKMKKAINQLPSTSDVRLPEEEVFARKIRIASIVRSPRNGPSVISEVMHEACRKGACLQDEIALLELAIRETRRFKRKAITEKLEANLLRLRTLS